METFNRSRGSLNYLRLAVLAFLSFGLLTGCGSTTEDSPVQRVEAQSVIGTNGQLISIQSDNVQAAGYDVNSMTMTVQFKNGYTYEYYGVSADLWNSFIAAQPHPWSQVGNPRLVQAGVPYKRIR
jgi:hypothetical protein